MTVYADPSTLAANVKLASSGAAANPYDLNSNIRNPIMALKDLLDGTEAHGAHYNFKPGAGFNFKVTLGDAAGVDDFEVYDSGVAKVFGIDSNGNLTLAGTVDGVDLAAHAAGTAYAQHTAGVGTHTHASLGAEGGQLLAANTHGTPSADTHHAQSHTHASHTGIGISDHHIKYTDAEAVTAVQAANPLALSNSLTIAGDLQVNGGDIGISADTDLLGLASGILTVRGSVGIGISPATKLHAYDATAGVWAVIQTAGVNVDANLQLLGTTHGWVFKVDESDSQKLLIGIGDTPTAFAGALVTLTTTGSVGIGTAPSAKLHVVGGLIAGGDGVQTELQGDLLLSRAGAQPYIFTNHATNNLQIRTGGSGEIILQGDTATGAVEVGQAANIVTFQTYGATHLATNAGSVGIGTISPNAANKVEIGGTITTASANARGLKVEPTFDGAGNGPGGLAFAPVFTPSASISAAYGIIGVPKADPPTGVTITAMYGGYFRVDTGNDAGALTTGYGVIVVAPVLGTIKPTNIRGIQVNNQGAAGVTTVHGLWVATQSGASNNYGAYFGSPVGINETLPDYMLDVNGAFGFTPGASVTPVDNGDVVIEATNNTTLTFKLKGSDATVRTGTLTLA